MLLLTPVRSEVFHARTSLFLSRNERSFVSSLGDKSCEIITILSGTLWSSGTLLISHSASIAGLSVKFSLLLFVLASLVLSDFSSWK
jgi:glucose uptake protein GlcU